ncbi:MAG: TatD family hydrolase [Lacipirellulaceae bacterium]
MLFDTHAHLDQPAFAADRPQVRARARAAGVLDVLAVGIDAASSEATVRLAAQHAMVHAAVGIQPNDVAQAAPRDWDRVVALAASPGVVALGETGLDRFWDHTPFAMQQDYFDRHLRLSQSSGLPVVIHLRDCEAEVLAMLAEARERGPLSGVMHSYTGTLDGALAAVELGLCVSFAGMVTYKKSDELRRVAAAVPLESLLVETDAPYLSPEPVRKVRRNEPAHVAHTARLLAETRGESFEEFARQTTANARRLFGL